jgi:hypothetical protein
MVQVVAAGLAAEMCGKGLYIAGINSSEYYRGKA